MARSSDSGTRAFTIVPVLSIVRKGVDQNPGPGGLRGLAARKPPGPVTHGQNWPPHLRQDRRSRLPPGERTLSDEEQMARSQTSNERRSRRPYVLALEFAMVALWSFARRTKQPTASIALHGGLAPPATPRGKELVTWSLTGSADVEVTDLAGVELRGRSVTGGAPRCGPSRLILAPLRSALSPLGGLRCGPLGVGAWSTPRPPAAPLARD